MDDETKEAIEIAMYGDVNHPGVGSGVRRAVLHALAVYHDRVVAPLERRVRAARPRSAPTTPVPPPEGQTTTTRAGELRLRAKRLREAADIVRAEPLFSGQNEVLRLVRSRASDLELEATAEEYKGVGR